MKTKMFISLLILFFSLLVYGQEAEKYTGNDAFTFGEKIKMEFKYSLYLDIPIGEVVFEVADEPKIMNDRKNYHLKATGTTYRFYDGLFKVRDRYETVLDIETFLPAASIRIINEGDFSMEENAIYDHTRKKVKRKKGNHIGYFNITPYTQDVLSSIFLARTFDYDNAKYGDTFIIHTFVDDSTYVLGVRYYGKEIIKTSKGKFRCIKLKPILVVGRIFESEEGMMLWITDDKNRMPVYAYSGISVGALKVTLVDYENLRHPLTSKQ
jgi:hypothetical protein